MHNFTEIALYVPEFRHLIQSEALPQTLESNRRQSGRSMTNVKDPFFYWLLRYCVPISVIFGKKLEEYCPKMCFGQIRLLVAL